MHAISPALRERCTAIGVFAAIGLAGAWSFDALVTGKFDALTPAAATHAAEPRHWYDRPLQEGEGWLSEPYAISAYVTPTSLDYDYPDPAPGAESALDGAPGRAPQARMREAYALPDDATLRAEIEALYHRLEAPSQHTQDQSLQSNAGLNAAALKPF